MSRPTERDHPTPISRPELLWLAGTILVGILLRCWFLNRIAIEHFDEGVYASNFWFGADQGYEYPARYLYAPPLLPAAIEWTMVLTSLVGSQPTGWVPVIPCLIAGLIAIPSMWWITRRWFGSVAGIVSAWLIATSDFHASYSRAALTDVPACLLILWGIYFTWKALQTGSARDVLIAGLFTGLSWSTKYNGWLPLAVGISGGGAALLPIAGGVSAVGTFARRWLLVACASALIWSPVLVSLQRHGGYRAVAANHQQYVSGINSWGSTAARQLQNIGTYDNLLSLTRDPVLQNGSSLQSCLDIVSPLLLLVVSLVAVVIWIGRNWRLPEQTSSGWFVLAWICGLTAATPFYHPYPRLVLPWLTAVWMGVGLAAQLLTERTGSPRSGLGAERALKADWWPMAIAALLLVTTVTHGAAGSLHCWQDRSELSKATGSIAALLKVQTSEAGFPEDEAIAYVYGDPAIVFGLKAHGLPLVGPVQNLDFLGTPRVRPTFFIRTDRMPPPASFQEQWAIHNSEFSPLVQHPIQVSHLVRMDDRRNTDASALRGLETIEVYRVR